MWRLGTGESMQAPGIERQHDLTKRMAVVFPQTSKKK
jgi:hypothetical protein